MNLRSRLKSHPELHAGALNDILFILLFFFLIVSTLANPNVIKLSQPKSKSDTKAKQTVVVSIDASNQFYVGTTRVSMEELKLKLQPMLAKDGKEASVVINADKKVPVENIVAVMRVARDLGAKTVLAVDKSGLQ
jgi:biopolymer transport protein ExbD